MDEKSKSLSIIAYYFSKYDLEAVKKLGYDSRTSAMRTTSLLLGKDNNYMKARRDEFDALTDSHRSGWKNREPKQAIKTLFEYMEQFSFNEVSDMVAALIESSQQSDMVLSGDEAAIYEYTVSYEEEVEQLINYEDSSASIVLTDATIARRKYNRNIITQLKTLYRYRCQICLFQSIVKYGKATAEAHHITHFIASHDNNADNIIILCPNHHRIIHATSPTLHREPLEFEYANGLVESITLNYHL